MNCLCCENYIDEDFPEKCPRCGAEFEHEAECDSDRWCPRVIVVKHSKDCLHELPAL